MIDLGFRDVKANNDLRQLAKYVAISVAAITGLLTAMLVGLGFVLVNTNLGPWIAVPFSLTLLIAITALAFKMARRAPVTVIKLREDTKQRPIPIVTLFYALIGAWLIVYVDPFVAIFIAPMVLILALTWKQRDRWPSAIRRIRNALVEGESVIGDCVAAAQGQWRKRDGGRALVATDRRVFAVMAGGERDKPIFDVPYDEILEFSHEWSRLGTGILRLTLARGTGPGPEKLVFTNIAPANLVSVIRALETSGAPPPSAATDAGDASLDVSKAARPPEAASAEFVPPAPWKPDYAGLHTSRFDRAMWLFLALIAVFAYGKTFGLQIVDWVGNTIAYLAIFPAICASCGFCSRTRWATLYVIPLNLALAPFYFFAAAGDAAAVAIVATVFAVPALWAGGVVGQAVQARRRKLQVT